MFRNKSSQGSTVSHRCTSTSSTRSQAVNIHNTWSQLNQLTMGSTIDLNTHSGCINDLLPSFYKLLSDECQCSQKDVCNFHSSWCRACQISPISCLLRLKLHLTRALARSKTKALTKIVRCYKLHGNIVASTHNIIFSGHFTKVGHGY